MMESFPDWLNIKLRELNTDENVFGSYIGSILESEENDEEKTEAIEGILSEIIENNLNQIVHEILDKWNACHPKVEKIQRTIEVDVDAQLARLLESQKIQTTVQRQELPPDELRIRAKILAQYSQLSISEDEDVESGGEETTQASGGGGGGGGTALVKNTNAHDVQQLAKERREQAKLESQKKKEKDKEDREKQKQLKEEKKEKRKTVKGERRR